MYQISMTMPTCSSKRGACPRQPGAQQVARRSVIAPSRTPHPVAMQADCYPAAAAGVSVRAS